MLHRFLSWGVHLFTASGAILALLALQAVIKGDVRTALLWIATSVVVDALDGTFARRISVKKHLPFFDGALLDNIVDYLTYAFVPALMILQGAYVPEGTELFSACLLLLCSAYCFCQRDAKTEDHFFLRFPSYWNIVVFYFEVFESSPITNLSWVLLCGILSFIPVKFIYPSRMNPPKGFEWFQSVFSLATWAWGAVIFWMLFTYPSFEGKAAPIFLGYALFYPTLYIVLSLLFTIRSMSQIPAHSGNK